MSYNGLVFEIDYSVSDYIESKLVSYSVYDGPGCSVTANFIAQLDFFNVWLTESDTDTGIGLESKQLKLSTQINTGTIAGSPVYIESGDEAQIQFCIRLSLMNMDASDPFATEINHVETAIGLTVDLKDNFQIKGQIVSAIDRGVETAEDSFFVEGFVCNEEGLRIIDSITYVQGQTVRVCIKPTTQAIDIGFRMGSIDRFTFWQGYVSQEAVVNGRAAINALTALYCSRGFEICYFETLLGAAFFQGPSTVEGSGFATLQFGSNSGGRRLDDQEQDDSNDFVRRELQGRQRTLQLDRFQIKGAVLRPRSSSAKRLQFLWPLILSTIALAMLATIVQ